MTYIELAPAFRGKHPLQQAFLRQVGVNWLEPWNWQDSQVTYNLWANHVTNKRAGHAAKRPVVDVFIEAFALRFQGLTTRNPKHLTAVRILCRDLELRRTDGKALGCGWPFVPKSLASTASEIASKPIRSGSEFLVAA